MASVTVDVEIDEFSDDEIREEYEYRLKRGKMVPAGIGDYQEKALGSLRSGKLEDCLYYLSMMLGGGFRDLPDALERYMKHARQAA